MRPRITGEVTKGSKQETERGLDDCCLALVLLVVLFLSLIRILCYTLSVSPFVGDQKRLRSEFPSFRLIPNVAFDSPTILSFSTPHRHISIYFYKYHCHSNYELEQVIHYLSTSFPLLWGDICG
jgi:hypothetical protein